MPFPSIPNDEGAVIDGANPSAEGEDADEGGEGGDSKKVLDIEDQFRLNKIEGGMDKKPFTGDLKGAPVQFLREVLRPKKLECGTIFQVAR